MIRIRSGRRRRSTAAAATTGKFGAVDLATLVKG
jgi:hypothetical protein